MPAIQTYEAKSIRTGYRAWRGDHNGIVQAIPSPERPGSVTLVVDCTPCGQTETWTGLPAHSAVHAEPHPVQP